MSIQEYLGIGGFIVVIFGAIIGLVVKVAGNTASIKTLPTWGQAREEFQDTKSCGLIHQRVNEKLTEMNAKLDKLLELNNAK